MRKGKRKIGIWILLVLSISPICSAGDLEFKGYYKTFFTAVKNPDLSGDAALDSDELDGLVMNTLRFESAFKVNECFSLSVAYALNPGIGINVDDFIQSQYPVPNPYSYRAYDFRNRIYPSPDDTDFTFSLHNNLDRLFLTFRPGFGDITFGRQPIAFGSSRVINPTDVIAPFTFQEIDKEERVGVDALRIRIPAGNMGEIDAGWVFGEAFRFSNSAFFAKLKTYVLNTDFSTILIGFRNNFLLGLDITRNIGGATAWIEGAYTFSNLLDNYLSDENYFRISAGADYKLSGSLYGFLEYHYSSAGKLDAQKYLGALATTAFREGGTYLLGQHYVTPGFVYEITPLLNLTNLIILNANDPSFFLSAVLQFNIAENIYIDTGAFITLGEKSDLSNPSSPVLTIKSEFGLYPDIYYCAARFYF